MVVQPLVSFIQIYCIISISVALFLNPQQTKYFGGLAIQLKQVGFFSKYKTAEYFVYVVSWLLIGIFCKYSFLLARMFA